MYSRRKFKIQIILEEDNFNNILEGRDIYKYYREYIMGYLSEINKVFSREPEKDYLKLEIKGKETRKDVSDVTRRQPEFTLEEVESQFCQFCNTENDLRYKYSWDGKRPWMKCCLNCFEDKLDQKNFWVMMLPDEITP